MTTVYEWYKSLTDFTVYTRPANISKNDVEYQFSKHDNHVMAFPELDKFRLEWISENAFKLTCKCCGR